MTDQEQIAAFIARKGVTRIAAGESSGISNRAWRAAARGELTDNDLIAKRVVRYDARGVAHVQNGLGEWIA